MLRIVHVSGDFPDPIEPFKTPAINNLLDLTANRFDHRVFSINRVTPGLGKFLADAARHLGHPSLRINDQLIPQGTALRYHAPPRGILHATMLRQLGDWLADRIAQGPRPDLIVGHKLAIEGIAVHHAAQRLGLPYALSIQGDTDTRILSTRPDLRPRLRRVFHEASVVFPFAPWALRRVEEQLGARSGPVVMLPCATDLDQAEQPSAGGSGLVSVFHLKNRKRKNLSGMVAAMRLLDAQGVATPLSVIGGGHDADMAQCRTMIGDQNSIRLEGAMDRAALRERMRGAIGFVMPSRRESFGLVFVEALFSGLPVVYPAGIAIDGFVNGLTFAIPVDAADPRSIAWGMRKLVSDEASLKHELGAWLASPDSRRFTRPVIAEDFSAGLREGAVQSR